MSHLVIPLNIVDSLFQYWGLSLVPYTSQANIPPLSFIPSPRQGLDAAIENPTSIGMCPWTAFVFQASQN